MPGPEPRRAARRIGRRLRLLRLGEGGGLGLALASAGSGLLCLLAEALGLLPRGRLALSLWAGASLLGLLAGALARGRRPLGEEEAAAWFDRRQGSRELLSAALLRARAAEAGGAPGPYDEEIGRKLEAYGEALRRPGYPLRGLGRRGLGALASLLSLGALLLWAEPSSLLRPPSPPPLREEEAWRLEETARSEGSLAPAEAQALGSWLFPEDRELAALAGRDLEEGKLGDLRALLRDAAKRAETGSAEERARRLAEDRRRLGSPPELAQAGSEGDAGSYAEGQAGSGAQGAPEGEGEATPGRGPQGRVPSDPGDASPAPDRKGGGEARPAPPAGPEGGGGGSEPGQGGGSASPGAPGAVDEGAGPGSDLPGEEIGSPRAGSGLGRSRSWGELSPEAKGPPLLLPLAADAPFFQSLLPGRRAPAEAAAAVGAAGRSAESGAGREELPADYLDSIRSYFLSLAGEAERAAGEAGGGQR